MLTKLETNVIEFNFGQSLTMNIPLNPRSLLLLLLPNVHLFLFFAVAEMHQWKSNLEILLVIMQKIMTLVGV